jgi:transposase
VNLKPWMNPGEVFRETAKRDARFIEWRIIDGKFDVALRKNAVSQAINKFGKYILLFRGKFTWEECLSLYRSKDVVEKGFDILKNDIDLMPVHIRTESTLRGYLFIAFLALILRMKLMRQMIQANLSKKFSVEGLIVANDLHIIPVTDFLEYHLFYPFLISARSSIISTYCPTKDLLISSSEAIFSAGIPSP